MPADVLTASSDDDAIELYHRNGWTDGLPIILPTPERVERFIAASERKASDEIGFYALRKRPATVEKLAVNAVMAGCLPEHLPVVIAIVECLLEPDVQFHVANSSTGSLPVGFIVNGPIRKALAMNCHGDVLGPGNRATSSIGRAVRLVQINVLGSVSGAGGSAGHGLPILDRSTIGHPAKYAGYHIVENEEDFLSLTPLHVQLGFERTDSVVTAFCTGGHIMLSNHAEKTPEEWLDSLAQYLVGTGRLIHDGFGVLIIPPESAAMFVDAGWSKAEIAEALYRKTLRSIAWVKTNGWKIGGRFQRGGPVEPGDELAELAIARPADKLHIVISGGPAGNFPAFIYTYCQGFRTASRKIG